MKCRQFGWRVPFALIGIPACILNVVVLFTVAEPKRGYADLSSTDAFRNAKGGEGGDHVVYAYNERITVGKFLGLFAIKSNVILFVQGIPGCLPWAASITFMNVCPFPHSYHPLPLPSLLPSM